MKKIIIHHGDDNLAHAELTKRILEKTELPHTLKHFPDGQSLVDSVYNIIQGTESESESEYLSRLVMLLDLRLAKLDGLEVLEKIKSDPRLQHIPVLILTASENIEDKKKVDEKGGDGYLVKPMGQEETDALVKELKARIMELKGLGERRFE